MHAASDPSRTKLTIAVATFRRPEGLDALLQSLDALAPIPAWADISLLVVDNDPAGPTAVNADKVASLCRWPVSVVPEPRRGIVHARNRILDAIPPDSDVLAFLDDDETVTPAWAQEMLTTLSSTGAAAAQGPVEPAYQTEAPAWVRDLEFFRIGPFQNRARIHFASTNNSCIRVEVLNSLGLRFDPAFNETGGEDEVFYHRLQSSGYDIVAAAGALVYDQVPAHRMTRAWHLKRARRIGNTLGRITLQSRHGRALRLLKGLGQVACGGARAATTGVLNNTERMRGLTTAAKGIGCLQAFALVTVKEYSQVAVGMDRRGEIGRAER